MSRLSNNARPWAAFVVFAVMATVGVLRLLLGDDAHGQRIVEVIATALLLGTGLGYLFWSRARRANGN